ncbi:MAG: Gldg family protein [Oligoflexus sp.]
MNNFRIPFMLIGVMAYFAANRYFSSYETFLPLLLGSYVCIAVSLIISLLIRQKAVKEGFHAESRCWNYVIVWQALILSGLLFYQIYQWSLAGEPHPASFLSKFLLALWLSLILLGACFAIGVELTFRESGRGKTAEFERVAAGGLRWLGIGLFLGFLVSLNYIAFKKDRAFDWSYFKTTKPGEATENIVRNLSDQVEVAAFFSRESDAAPFVRQYLESLSSFSPQLQISFYDKDFSPVQAEEFRAARNGQVILMKESKRQRVEIGDTLEAARKKLQTLDENFQKVLLALIEEKKTIYVTQGHGEMSWKAGTANPWRSLRNFERLLRAQNYQVRELSLTTGNFSEVPKDAAAVAIIGASYSFSQSAVQILRDYVQNGGKLLLFLDIEFSGEEQESIDFSDDSLSGWLEEIGIEYVRDMLANDRTFMRHTNRNVDHGFLASNNFSSHESVSSLAKNDERMGVITYQSGFFQVTDQKNGWRLSPVIRSLATSFNDKNANFKFDDKQDEVREAYPIAVAAQKDDSQIFAYADASMISDPLIRNPGNQLAVADVVKWLIGDMAYSGATETEEDIKIQHSKARELFVFHGSIYVIPLLVLLAGFLATRRKKGALS